MGYAGVAIRALYIPVDARTWEIVTLERECNMANRMEQVDRILNYVPKVFTTWPY